METAELVQFLEQNAPVIALVAAIVTTLKGIALWKAAQRSQKNWFIALLFINSLGILELIYIFVISKRYSVKVQKE